MNYYVTMTDPFLIPFPLRVEGFALLRRVYISEKSWKLEHGLDSRNFGEENQTITFEPHPYVFWLCLRCRLPERLYHLPVEHQLETKCAHIQVHWKQSTSNSNDDSDG